MGNKISSFRSVAMGAFCLTAIGFVCAVPAHAQAEGEASQRFTPADFSQYAPRTALDMAQRIPGFSISGGNSGGRGLGQAGANVLINGARISGKSTSARDSLSRIPAGTVIALDIIDGASLSIPGLSGDVLNVTTQASALSGTWEWEPELRQTQEPNLERGTVSIAGRRGRLGFTAGLEANAFRGGGDGREFEAGPDGIVYEIADERGRGRGQSPEATLALTWDHSDDVIANFNVAYSQSNSNRAELSERGAVLPRGLTETVLFDRYEDEREGEISADIIFPVGSGRLKLIGVAGFEDSPARSRVRAFENDIQTERTEFYSQGDEGEKIIRAEYSRTLGGHDWQISGETAFNFVELSNSLFELNGGVFSQSALDDPNVRVEEDREEITLTHGRTLTPKLDVQASIGVEQSTLTQSGNASNAREFIRPKGFANFSYAASESLTARLEIARRVDQLNFFDFISGVNIADDTSVASNSELVPQQYWNYAVEFDKNFSGGHTFLLRLYFEDIEDLVERIPVGPDSDAVGNIDAASSAGVKLETTLKGEPWGFAGTELNFEYFMQRTQVEDPLTGQSRRISNRTNSFIEFDFRHDIPGTNWAYGFGAQKEREAPDYSLDEIDGEYFTQPFSNVFVEHKDVFGMTANIKLLNLFGAKEGRRRTVYDGRRDLGRVDFTQQRERAFGRILRMTFSGTF